MSGHRIHRSIAWRLVAMLPRAWRVGLLLTLVGSGALWAQNPHPQPVRARGDRVLSFSITEAADNDFGAALDQARAAGAQALSMSIDWSDFERAPGVFLPADDPENFLTIANAFFPADGIKVALFFRPVVTLARSVPADLADLPFDDPEMIARFLAFLDYAFARIPDLALTSVAIGSEFDVRFGADAGAWRAYTRLVRASVQHIHQDPRIRARFPSLLVGAEITFPSLVESPQRELALTLNQETDVVMVSYYPLAAGRVQNPTVVHADFAALASLYPARPIHFMQIGYPSGYFSPDFYDLERLTPVLGSSEGKQRRFIREVFRAWDDHAAQVKLMTFTWLTDISPEAASHFANDDPAFSVPGDASHLEFLATLGLRTHAGTGKDKAAMRQLRRETAARGWSRATRPPGTPCALPPGHPRFCQECGPCADGAGDCDRDSECAPGLACIDNVGRQFGFAPGIDVCVASSGGDMGGGACPLPPGHPHFCRDCGPCAADQGDCDRDSECAPGLTCVDDIGPAFGFGPRVDVCR